MARASRRRPIRATVGPVAGSGYKLFQRAPGGDYVPRVPEAYAYESVKAVYDIERGGIRKFADQLGRLVSHMETQAEFVAYEALRPTFELSQTYVPVETGDLKRSGVIEMRLRGRRKEHVCEIGYGRSGQPFYAVFVHENMEMGHLPPTSAKFLLRALIEDEANIADRVKKFSQIMLGKVL